MWHPVIDVPPTPKFLGFGGYMLPIILRLMGDSLPGRTGGHDVLLVVIVIQIRA